MALTTAQQVRLKIQDLPTRAVYDFYGDGYASAYTLPHSNLSSGTAYVQPGGTAWSATGATFDASGFVAFSSPISANSAVQAVYVHSVFSEDEIGHFTAVGGDVNGAALEAIESLMFDSLKRARWAAADGTQYDDTKAQDTLLKMYDVLQHQRQDDVIGQGATQSWSINQESY